MNKSKSKSLISALNVYSVAGQFGFAVLVPLLLFIWGGVSLARYLALPQWTTTLCVILGILSMICGLCNFIAMLIHRYGQDKVCSVEAKPTPRFNRRDNDYSRLN
ncbi:MAG: hypothetical protein LBN40_00865 [Oscillospiraceae bacterium]|jgi:cbb3-type cytochrome oxidase subunit 1|nr:hypothetical protein [Oscillospiraceae bacterium]